PQRRAKGAVHQQPTPGLRLLLKNACTSRLLRSGICRSVLIAQTQALNTRQKLPPAILPHSSGVNPCLSISPITVYIMPSVWSDVLHLRNSEQTACFMVLLKRPIGGPSSILIKSGKPLKTVDATHPY